MPSLLTLSDTWEEYRKNEVVEFEASHTSATCEKTTSIMRAHPEFFSGFRMQFKKQAKDTFSAITITANAISSGKFISHLHQQFPDKKEIYLTAEGEQQLLSEIVNNVVVRIIGDDALINPTSGIYEELQKRLIDSTRIYNAVNASMWNSVFWEKDSYRPDRISEELNEIYDKADKDKKEAIKEAVASSHDTSVKAEVDYIGIVGVKAGGSHKNSQNTDKSKEEAQHFINEARARVEWKGERFVPKPIKLSKVNLAKIVDSSNFAE